MRVVDELSVDETRLLARRRSRSNFWIGAVLLVITGAMYALSIDHAQREVAAPSPSVLRAAD